MNTPRIYVGTYAKYNNASLEGKWLDLDDYSDAEEFLQACAELHKDEADPEFMFQDYENFPENLYGESMSQKDIEKIYEYIRIMQKIGDTPDWLDLHNQYCDNAGYSDDRIYEFDEEFFETYFSGKVMDAVQKAVFGDINWGHNHITFDGYGNFKSIADLDNFIDKDTIIQHIMENEQDYSL
jgi:antirestriction protein